MIEAIVMLCFAVAGFGAVVYGVGQWSSPAGWVVFGCCCLVMAAWPVLRSRWMS